MAPPLGVRATASYHLTFLNGHLKPGRTQVTSAVRTSLASRKWEPGTVASLNEACGITSFARHVCPEILWQIAPLMWRQTAAEWRGEQGARQPLLLYFYLFVNKPDQASLSFSARHRMAGADLFGCSFLSLYISLLYGLWRHCDEEDRNYPQETEISCLKVLIH